MSQPWVQLHDLESGGQSSATTPLSRDNDHDIRHRQTSSDDDFEISSPGEEVGTELTPSRTPSIKALSVEERKLDPTSSAHQPRLREGWANIVLHNWWLETLAMISVIIMFGTIVLTLRIHDGGALADWSFPIISINALVAVQGVVLKASMILVVSQGKLFARSACCLLTI
jgi:hypothetical protein